MKYSDKFKIKNTVVYNDIDEPMVYHEPEVNCELCLSETNWYSVLFRIPLCSDECYDLYKRGYTDSFK